MSSRPSAARAARRYFLTAERFDARRALGLGLVSAVVPTADLATEASRLADILCQNGPAAMAEAEAADRRCDRSPDRCGIANRDGGAHRPPARSAEGREGVAAFLEKRKPSWQG
jgi:Dihydroxynaphthoic acid synthase